MSVRVSEVNKFSPQFAFSSYAVSVESNTSYLLTAQAPDRDTGPWGVVTYQISPTQDYRRVSVDPSTGEVTTLTPLTYSSSIETTYRFRLTATDPGGLRATADVTVTVTGATVQPTFVKSDYTFTVSYLLGAYK